MFSRCLSTPTLTSEDGSSVCLFRRRFLVWSIAIISPSRRWQGTSQTFMTCWKCTPSSLMMKGWRGMWRVGADCGPVISRTSTHFRSVCFLCFLMLFFVVLWVFLILSSHLPLSAFWCSALSSSPWFSHLFVFPLFLVVFPLFFSCMADPTSLFLSLSHFLSFSSCLPSRLVIPISLLCLVVLAVCLSLSPLFDAAHGLWDLCLYSISPRTSRPDRSLPATQSLRASSSCLLFLPLLCAVVGRRMDYFAVEFTFACVSPLECVAKATIRWSLQIDWSVSCYWFRWSWFIETPSFFFFRFFFIFRFSLCFSSLSSSSLAFIWLLCFDELLLSAPPLSWIIRPSSSRRRKQRRRTEEERRLWHSWPCFHTLTSSRVARAFVSMSPSQCLVLRPVWWWLNGGISFHCICCCSVDSLKLLLLITHAIFLFSLRYLTSSPQIPSSSVSLRSFFLLFLFSSILIDFCQASTKCRAFVSANLSIALLLDHCFCLVSCCVFALCAGSVSVLLYGPAIVIISSVLLHNVSINSLFGLFGNFLMQHRARLIRINTTIGIKHEVNAKWEKAMVAWEGCGEERWWERMMINFDERWKWRWQWAIKHIPRLQQEKQQQQNDDEVVLFLSWHFLQDPARAVSETKPQSIQVEESRN